MKKSSLANSTIFLFILLFFINNANADSLVTRDDFICYDSSGVLYGYWPSISIDAKGYLYQSNGNRLLNESLVHQFNRFDNFGNQLQPVINFLPDTISDSAWRGFSNIPIYCNDAGNVLISNRNILLNGDIDRIFSYFIDSTGTQIESPLCLTCESAYDPYFYNIPFGAINNNNVSAIVMDAYPGLHNETKDSVLIRLYFQENDSLSPIINAMNIPHPLESEPEYGGDYEIQHSVAIGIADDNSFAATWDARSKDLDWAHVYYVVYNADGTPRTDVMMADCDGAFSDTANCVTENVHRVDMMMAPSGDFYITWYEIHWTAPYYVQSHIWMRGFNPDGTPKYDAVRVNEADTLWNEFGQEIPPKLSCDNSGNVLICWSDARLHPENGIPVYRADVFAQKIDPFGNLVGHNMRINNNFGMSGVNSRHFDCDINDAGQAVFIWSDVNSAVAIKAQLMPYDQVGRFAPGDINADMSGDIADLTTFVNYMFKGNQNSFWPRDLINFNGDSSNGDISDLTYFVNYMFKGGPVPNMPDEGIRPNPGKFNPYE